MVLVRVGHLPVHRTYLHQQICPWVLETQFLARCSILGTSFLSSYSSSNSLQVFGILATVMVQNAVDWGMGAHESDLEKLDPTLVTQSLFWPWVSASTAILSICFAKNSIIAFIVQMHGKTIKRWQRWFLRSLALSNIITTLVTFPLIWKTCKPINKLWDVNAPGTCPLYNFNVIYLTVIGSMEIPLLACEVLLTRYSILRSSGSRTLSVSDHDLP